MAPKRATRRQLALLEAAIQRSDEPENDWLVMLAGHIAWQQRRIKQLVERVADLERR